MASGFEEPERASTIAQLWLILEQKKKCQLDDIYPAKSTESDLQQWIKMEEDLASQPVNYQGTSELIVERCGRLSAQMMMHRAPIVWRPR